MDRKEEAQVGCQTDQFLDRESDGQTEYKPRKTGIDAQTQIYNGDVGCFFSLQSPVNLPHLTRRHLSVRTTVKSMSLLMYSNVGG